MSQGRWTPVGPDDEDAPAGELVTVITPGGDERDLIRQGRLWFLPDKSMYVYFTPVFWRPKEES